MVSRGGAEQVLELGTWRRGDGADLAGQWKGSVNPARSSVPTLRIRGPPLQPAGCRVASSSSLPSPSQQAPGPQGAGAGSGLGQGAFHGPSQEDPTFKAQQTLRLALSHSFLRTSPPGPGTRARRRSPRGTPPPTRATCRSHSARGQNSPKPTPSMATPPHLGPRSSPLSSRRDSQPAALFLGARRGALSEDGRSEGGREGGTRHQRHRSPLSVAAPGPGATPPAAPGLLGTRSPPSRKLRCGRTRRAGRQRRPRPAPRGSSRRCPAAARPAPRGPGVPDHCVRGSARPAATGTCGRAGGGARTAPTCGLRRRGGRSSRRSGDGRGRGPGAAPSALRAPRPRRGPAPGGAPPLLQPCPRLSARRGRPGCRPTPYPPPTRAEPQPEDHP